MPRDQRFRIRVHDREHDVLVTLEDDRTATAVVDGERFTVVEAGDGMSIVHHPDQIGQTAVVLDPGRPPTEASVRGRAHRLEVKTAQALAAEAALAAAHGSAGAEKVMAPMPGRIVRVLVNQGDVVTSGAAVIIVEAMKMENELGTTIAGRVTMVHVAEGDTVDAGQLLCEIEAHDADGSS